MLIEVDDDALFFQAVSGKGKVVDAGCIPRTAEPPANGSRAHCPIG